MAVASHDTGSAVAAVPALEGSYIAVKWSLMGVGLTSLLRDKTYEWNYQRGWGEGTYS